MKQKIALLFFVLLLSSFSAYARLLLQQEGPKQGQNEVIIANTLVHTSHNDELKDDIKELMGYENCDEKNEECYGRRMTLEAHLDYIYTQNMQRCLTFSHTLNQKMMISIS
ncbi:putative phytosulfokines 6 isoform X2 [Arachis hypogaea]|uniref:putative phytosulfokines 6 isoform X2 n=1 Tax=Arachis hypogaea TaxID=3818 RepID=UPI000DECF974|nr:putative phytosulfokines 6 isoform X2 [Arachis hypogaea]XP_025663455.1 putative phytosulfokines 6 isoform X2 [Arachis hypogaea]QHO26000.1 Putative phytosulfokines [Arachis hypogaea]